MKVCKIVELHTTALRAPGPWMTEGTLTTRRTVGGALKVLFVSAACDVSFLLHAVRRSTRSVQSSALLCLPVLVEARRRCVVPNGRKKKSCPAQAHPLWLYGCAQVAAPRHVPALARGMAGAIKVHEANQEEVVGPAMVARTEAKIEMGVRYEAGVPSPMEGAHFNEPIVVDGLVAKTGGGALGCPVQYIKLSAWCENGRGRTLNT